MSHRTLSTMIQILDGPNLTHFLKAALRGGTGLVNFMVLSSEIMLRDSGPDVVTIMVELSLAYPDGTEGHRYMFEGRFRGRNVRGLYIAKSNDSRTQTGALRFV